MEELKLCWRELGEGMREVMGDLRWHHRFLTLSESIKPLKVQELGCHQLLRVSLFLRGGCERFILNIIEAELSILSISIDHELKILIFETYIL